MLKIIRNRNGSHEIEGGTLPNPQQATKRPVTVEVYLMDEEFEVETLEGTMKGGPRNWLIRGVQGELYPCNPGIFRETYCLESEK